MGRGSKPVNLAGQSFGRLLVVEITDQRTPNRNVIWKCRCSCGNEVLVSSENLKRGFTKSCGCLQKEVASAVAKKTNTKHKASEHAKVEYEAWNHLKQKPDEWKDFLDFFCDVGERPSPEHRLWKRDVRKPHSKKNTYWKNFNDERAESEQLTSADLPEDCTFDFRAHLRATASA